MIITYIQTRRAVAARFKMSGRTEGGMIAARVSHTSQLARAQSERLTGRLA